MVHLLLTSNLPFARVCGFVPKGENSVYWYKHVPSLRKLEQLGANDIIPKCGIKKAIITMGYPSHHIGKMDFFTRKGRKLETFRT